MTTTTALAIELIDSQQEQHEVTANEALTVLDAAVARQLDFAIPTNANYSLTTTGVPAQWQYSVINITDVAAVLTADRDIIWPNVGRRGPFMFINSTARTLTVKRTGQSGVAVPPSGRYVLQDNGTDVKIYTTLFPAENKIINGDMNIDQRNAGAAVTPADATPTVTLDRMLFNKSTTGAASVQQSTDVPTGSGFVNSLKLTVTTADAAVAAGDFVTIGQKIEGQNVADLLFGSSLAKAVIVSFWVKSSITGTFGVSLRNSATNRSYPGTITISTANVWIQKSITLTGDLTGTWLTTSGVGIEVSIALMSGSTFNGTLNTWAAANLLSTSSQTNWMATNANTFFITGLQLKVGNGITEFNPEPFNRRLAACHRYYEKSFAMATAPAQNVGINTGELQGIIGVAAADVNSVKLSGRFSVRKRVTPILTLYNPAAANGEVRDITAAGDCSAVASGNLSEGGFRVDATGNAGGIVGGLAAIHWAASAEL